LPSFLLFSLPYLYLHENALMLWTLPFSPNFMRILITWYTRFNKHYKWMQKTFLRSPHATRNHQYW
jgi:hypothetical protein